MLNWARSRERTEELSLDKGKLGPDKREGLGLNKTEEISLDDRDGTGKDGGAHCSLNENDWTPDQDRTTEESTSTKMTETREREESEERKSSICMKMRKERMIRGLTWRAATRVCTASVRNR